MLSWQDIETLTTQGNLEPDHKIIKTDHQWCQVLTPEQYRVTRQKGTERSFSSPMCGLFEPGLYACVSCNTRLFDANQKFDSRTGWPSFTQPIKKNVIAYHADAAHGMSRVEAVCNVCDAHLGHVFPDGPPPSGLRYCINAIALKKTETAGTELATFGGGCFWCTEAIFNELEGVLKVESGYSGGRRENPTYQQVSTGSTGHAEVVQITFDSTSIPYEALVKIHLTTHDPTTPNKQGADSGTQYRSVIFFHTPQQHEAATRVMMALSPEFNSPVVTEIEPCQQFFKAEAAHQNYYRRNENDGYCQAVINPKIATLRKRHAHHLK